MKTEYKANKMNKLLVNIKSNSFRFVLINSIHGTKVNEKRTSYRIIGAKSEKIRLEFINLYTNEVSSLDIN